MKQSSFLIQISEFEGKIIKRAEIVIFFVQIFEFNGKIKKNNEVSFDGVNTLLKILSYVPFFCMNFKQIDRLVTRRRGVTYT